MHSPVPSPLPAPMLLDKGKKIPLLCASADAHQLGGVPVPLQSGIHCGAILTFLLLVHPPPHGCAALRSKQRIELKRYNQL